MRIGILGTGIVGRTVGEKLLELGHEVKMGARQAGNETASAWHSATGRNRDACHSGPDDPQGSWRVARRWSR